MTADPALPAAAAELAACLAIADPAAGVPPDRASAAARRACDLAALLGRPREQGRAGAWLCAQLLRMGRHAEVLQHAPAAQALLDGGDDPAPLRALLRAVAMAGSELGIFDVAMDAAHEMVRITTPEGAAGPSLDAGLALGVCFERMGDSWHAGRLIAAALASRGDATPDRQLLEATNALCAISLGIMHRLLDTGADDEVQQVLADARAAIDRARSLLALVPDPVYEVAVLGNLGEVLLYQGDATAAGNLLHQARDLAVQRGLGAYAWRLQASLGAWLLVARGPQAALDAMRELLADMAAAAPQQTLIRTHHVAYRACRALGHFDQALAHFEVVERTERQRAVSQLRAQSQLFVTRTEARHALWQAEQARQDARHQRQRAAEFAASAERDPLTGLGNRRHLDRRFAELLPLAARAAQPLTLVQIDIDHFKAINDQHGHAAGDRVLVTMAQLLRDNTRAGDVLARHGGEEFVIVLPGMELDHAAEVCERLRERVAGHRWGGPAVTISLGLAAAPPYDAPVLLQHADEALYHAKRTGRNRVCLSPVAV